MLVKIKGGSVGHAWIDPKAVEKVEAYEKDIADHSYDVKTVTRTVLCTTKAYVTVDGDLVNELATAINLLCEDKCPWCGKKLGHRLGDGRCNWVSSMHILKRWEEEHS